MHRIALAVRLKTLPLSFGAVFVVAADASGRDLSPGALRVAACIGIAASFHVAGILISDVFDHRAGTDKLARLDRNAIPTGSLQLEAGTLTVRHVAWVAAGALALAAGLVALLGDAGAWVWFGAAFACVWSYAAPPLRLSYVGSGFGELVIAFAYGPLLGAGTARALDVPFTRSAWMAASATGVLVAMAYASHHFLHWRADRQASKRTPVVVFGEDGALIFIGITDLAAFLTILTAVAIGTLPPLCALALLGAPVVAVAIRRASDDPVAQRILGLIGAHLAAVLFAALGLSLGLLLR